MFSASASASGVGLLFVGVGVTVGALLAAKGAQNAKRYCNALIRHGMANITRAAVEIHKGWLE